MGRGYRRRPFFLSGSLVRCASTPLSVAPKTSQRARRKSVADGRSCRRHRAADRLDGASGCCCDFRGLEISGSDRCSSLHLDFEYIAALIFQDVDLVLILIRIMMKGRPHIAPCSEPEDPVGNENFRKSIKEGSVSRNAIFRQSR